jgi:hypothetical protein
MDELIKVTSNWADQSLTVLGESYKRNLRAISFFIGLGVAVAFNIDTLFLTEHLYRNKESRDATVALALKITEKTDKEVFDACLTLPLEKRKADPAAQSCSDWWITSKSRASRGASCRSAGRTHLQVTSIPGWLLTALALSLGAPFWFDLLNKIVNVRHGIAKPETRRRLASQKPEFALRAEVATSLRAVVGETQTSAPDACDALWFGVSMPGDKAPCPSGIEALPWRTKRPLPPPHILRRYFTMAYPFQLVVADPKKLRKIAKHARKLVDSRNGDPVIAISSMRIVLTPAAVGEIVDQAPTEDVTGRRLSFDELMARMGAESTSPLGPARLSELLAAREPAELGALPRQELDESDLIRDGWDWHLKETRLVEAWDVFGGPENIDWKDIRVGQMDTGFRRIPALGFENADSPGPASFSPISTETSCRAIFSTTHSRASATFANEFSAEDPMLGGPFDGHGTRTGSVLAGYDPAATPVLRRRAAVPYIPVRISDTVIINHAQEGLARAISTLSVTAAAY